jgi:hypothetical protein
MSKPMVLMIVVSVLLAGCTGGSRTSATAPVGDPATNAPAPAAPAPRIAPTEVAEALEALSLQMQQQVQAAADEMERLLPGNDTRRRTLRWRIRMAEVSTQARWRDNAIAGVIELWFWTIVTERHMTVGEPAQYFAAHRERLTERLHALVVTAENLVRRCVPPERFDELHRRVTAAAESGDAFVTGKGSETNPLSGLLEASRLESLIAIPLSPFSAFEGVKTGGDAAAQLSVVAARAVDLMATYPQLINWHLQVAMVEMQSQDGVAGLLREVHQANTSVSELLTTIRAMPAQVRTETVALLDQSRTAQGDVRDTLASATKAAEALEKLTTAIDTMLARVMPPADAATTAKEGPPGRPFDIREYTAALEATAVAARDLRATLASAEAIIAAPAIPQRVAEVDRSLHSLVTTIAGWCIAVLLIASACVIVVVKVLRRSTTRQP